MDSMDKQLKRDLAGDPLTRNGFNDRLRKRIEERLDEAPAKRRSWRLRLAGAGTGLVMLLVVIVALVQLQPQALPETTGAGSAADEYRTEERLALPANVQPARSALLLGLRKDEADAGSYDSTYRTLLVTAEGTEPVIEAEGAGILLPHGQHFWRLYTAAGGERESGAYQLIAAYNTASAAGEYKQLLQQRVNQESAKPDAGAVKEKVRFAGNRYVALSRQAEGRESYWVMDIEQLARPRSARAARQGVEPHTAGVMTADMRLKAMPSDELPPNGAGQLNNWTVARKPGKWTVQSAAASPGANGVAPVLADLPVAPDEAVVNYDELTVAWADIRNAQPAAVDAFSSPAGNLAAVVTDKSLIFYGVAEGQLEERSVEEALLPGEQVVMAQWAIGHYVDLWKENAGSLLTAGEAVR